MSSKAKSWLKFLLGLLCLIISLRVVTLIEHIPWIKEEYKALRDAGIQSGLFWWADVKETSEAERFFRGLRR